MAGYVRQSVADIVNGENITAPPINAELNQIQAAFNSGTGHTHDGSIGSAPKIDLTTSISGYLPSIHGGVGGKHNVDAVTNPSALDDFSEGYARGSLWLNSTSNRMFFCVSADTGYAIWHEFAAISALSNWLPQTTGTTDIGSSALAFRDIFITGDITSARIDGTVGSVTPNPITGTTITANDGFDGSITGQVKSEDGTVVLENGSDYTLAHFTGSVTGDILGNVVGDVTGDVRGSVKADNGDVVLNSGTDGTDATFTGDVYGTHFGDVQGDIYAANGTSKIIENGADGEQAVFTGSVVGNLTGRTTGEHVGPVNADGNRLSNLAEPTESSDAVSRGYFERILGESEDGISASLVAAQSARDFAEDYRDSSLVYRNAAEGFRDEAEGFRDQAANYSSIATDKAAIVSTLYDTAQYNVRLIGSLV